MPRQGFVIYHDNIGRINKLTTEQKGKLLDALCAYSESGDVQINDDDLALWMVFDVMRDAIDRDSKKYDNKSRAGKQNIAARWENQIPTDTNEYQPIPNDTNRYQRIPTDTNHFEPIPTDTNFLTGTESGTETESGSGSESDCQQQTKVIRYCQDATMFLSGAHMDEIFDFLNDGIDADMQMLAVDLTLENGSRAWAYARTIITRWRDSGIRSIEAARNEQAAHKAKKQPQKSETQPMYSPLYTRAEDYVTPDD
jgi:DnaD/phage-associated family protein